MMLRILIINTTASSGGAAIAASRLNHALNSSDCGVESSMLVMEHNLHNRFSFIWERFVIWVSNRFSRKNLFQVSIANTGCDITDTEEFKQADIIHLHWTQQGFLSLKGMEQIFLSGKPVVWTMHDMWASTGICHFDDGCGKYSTQCTECPMLVTGGSKDLSFRTFARKLRIFSQSGFTIITCSDWLHAKAAESALLKGKRIVTIPNTIDTAIYRPMSVGEARKAFGLPEDAKLVLFASQKVTDRRKGIDYLVDASRILLSHSKNVEFVIMGGHSEDIASRLSFPCHSLGYISSPEMAALVYSACDVFVTPSLMENLPNTVMEAMACGTPCVGFNVGGIPEMIDHKINGYVAGVRDSGYLAAGIEWILGHSDYAGLSKAAVKKVSTAYSEDNIARRHLELYKSLM